MYNYNDRGYIITDLWNKNTRVKSTEEAFSERGGMTKGRIDIDWAFYLDPKIKPVRVTTYWDDSSQTVTDYNEPSDLKTLWQELGVKVKPTPDSNGLHFEIDTALKNPAAKGLGVLRIELDYVNTNDWVMVSHHAEGTSHTEAFDVQAGRNFEICLVFNRSTEYLTDTILADVPLPMSNRTVKFGIDGAQYQIMFITMQGVTKATILKIQGPEYETVFMRYL